MRSYAARVGQHKRYFTTQQAFAYERAYAAFPIQPWGLAESAAMDGYRDAKAAADAAKTAAATEHAAAHPDHRKGTICAA